MHVNHHQRDCEEGAPLVQQHCRRLNTDSLFVTWQISSSSAALPIIETIYTKENLFLRVLLPYALGADHVKVFLDNLTLRVEADLLNGTSRLLSSSLLRH